MIIQGKRLYIRSLKLSDVDYIMEWVNDPGVVKNFQHFDKKFSRKDEIIFIKKVLKSKNDFPFSIFRKSDDQYIGQVAINWIIWENRLGRLAILIKREYWGKRYAQEAIPLILQFTFQKLKLNKVWLMAYANNKKALHLYKKLGFKKEGVLRKEYYWNGKYHDMVRSGILREEFKN